VIGPLAYKEKAFTLPEKYKRYPLCYRVPAPSRKNAMACSTFGKTTLTVLMKHLLLLMTFSACIISCNRSSPNQELGKEESIKENPNQALYNEVMNVHDDVMPKLDDIYRLKRDLQDSLAVAITLTIEQKEKIDKQIGDLDSASQAMMDWMHQFNPLPDSADQEEAREYLESEMERIKKVRDVMLEAIDRARHQQ
jgi:hypothetical protein